jgi:tRNA threonylcarbamoyl adenosine modification protein YeaZ
MLLALDTCFASCSVAVFDLGNCHVVAERRELLERGHAELVGPMVRSALADARISVSDLTRVAVTTGPGTFTGIRIGLAFAQGLALARKIPLSPLDAMRATAAPLMASGRAASVVHAAGASGYCYVQHFDANGNTASDLLLQRPGQIAFPMGSIVIGTGANSVAGGAARSTEHDLPNAAGFAALAVTLDQHDPSAVQPVYIRPPDIKLQAHLPLIRRVGGEAADILALLHEAGSTDAWPAETFASLLSSRGTFALLAERPGFEPLGFALVRTVLDEAEILMIAIHPVEWRKGNARHLLSKLESHLRSQGIKTIHLEVAKDNAPAMALYQSASYASTGERKSYYPRQGASAVDAIMMTRSL